MAPNKFATMLHRRTNKITGLLIYAFLEWTLIFLLLINSLFSYFILKFALYFGLKTPCFLCSRLDHFLDSHKKAKHNKPTFSSYSEIICEQHAAEISKIGYCSHHRKLVESHNLCGSCSSSSSNDPELVKWLTETGVVKAAADDDAEGDATNKCSCCDGVLIKTSPISKVSSDFVIKERELLGELFSDHNVQIGSDQSDDQPKFGYQILDDDAEEEEDASEDDNVIFEAEKKPLLDYIKENNGEKEEAVSVTTQNLCPDMLPQHLEFYIDHDDYRLIPIEVVNDDSIKVGSKSEKVSRAVGEDERKEILGFPREFELVFDGYELLLPVCELTTSKDLPCIQEEEESVIENSQTSNDEEKMEGSDKVELVSDGNELLAAGWDTGNSHISENESMGVSEKIGLVLEGNELLVTVCETEKSQNFKGVEKIGGSDKFAMVFEGNKFLTGIESENLLNPNDKQNEDGSEKFDLVFEGDQLVGGSESDIISVSSPKGEDEYSPENWQICEDEKEDPFISQPLQEHKKKRKIDISTLLEEQEDIATVENTPMSEEQNSIEAMEEEDSKVTTETHSLSPVYTEDNAAFHLKTDETGTDEKEQNPTEKFQEYEANLASLMISYEMETETEKYQNSKDEILIVVDEPPTACKQESHSFTVNVVSNDHEISERSQNVGMSHNEVEEERVPDTPTSSESLHKNLLLLRRESATEESLDGMSMISEPESTGQTVEKLKVDLLTERKAFRVIYKELEEERNASAIAANQTMAMITRLQEEKATMQMEALQYQRMMEEQSEYDQEALQMMNELVVKREKEKQELEKELEVYRKKVMDYEERERMRIICRRRSRNSSASCSYGEESDSQSIDLNQEEDAPHSQEENGHQDTPTDAVLCLQDSLAGFEEERHAILEQLKVLEEKLLTLAEEEEEHFENMKPFEQFYEENGKDFDVNGGDTNGFIHANGNHLQERKINDSMPKKLLLPLFDAVEFSESPNGELNGNEDGFSITKFELEKKRFAVEEEVDHVYERLQALEADREFLKHCIGSLRKGGDKGLDLLQEILKHLRDLKNVEVQAMKNTDHGASV